MGDRSCVSVEFSNAKRKDVGVGGDRERACTIVRIVF